MKMNRYFALALAAVFALALHGRQSNPLSAEAKRAFNGIKTTS
jgi:hypothetical protein